MTDALPGRSESVRITFTCIESEATEDFLARAKAVMTYVDEHWDDLAGRDEPIDADELPH